MHHFPPLLLRSISSSSINVSLHHFTIPSEASTWQTAAPAFAAAQGKPLAICEWGIAFLTSGHGLGDDPHYVNEMVSWMQNPSNDVTYESYFDANSGGVNSLITGGSFPNSLAAFSADLG